MYLKIIHIDAITKIPCTEAPMKSGPLIPTIKGLSYRFSNAITVPEYDAEGICTLPMYFYGECDDDADVNVSGVVAILSQAEYDTAYQDEFERRKPYPSWTGDYATMHYVAPVNPPSDGQIYSWDEATLSWTLN